MGTGVLLTLACTRVKVTWDQPASAAAPGAPPAVQGAPNPPSAPNAIVPALPGAAEGPRAVSQSFAQIADQLAPSVVSIRVEKKQKAPRMRNPFHDFPFPFPFGGPDGPGDDDEERGMVQRGAGSGVVIDEKGMILTNNHVVGGADKIEVRFVDGRELPAKVVGTDPRSDLAVIRVDTKSYGVRAARLGDSDKMRVGEWVMAIGNPFGLDHTVTVGVISAKGRAGIGDTRGGYQDFLQTDASINPGNSGGPLVNLAGEVIGINTAILGPGGNIGIGFAVPSSMARPIADELVATGKVRRPYLGIRMQEMPAKMAKAMGAPEKGALVQAVEQGAPADKAGVKRGDVILSVDGKRVDGSRDVQRQVLTHRVGDTVGLAVWRDGKTVDLKVRTAELPSDEKAQAGGDDSEKKGKLGLSLQELTPQLAERLGVSGRGGVVISGVRGGSPAAEANLNRGDVILEIDRRPVRSVQEAVKALTAERPGGHVLLVQRGEQSFYVLLQTGE
jgi:serine protease Do